LYHFPFWQAIFGSFAPNPRNGNKPMMILNDKNGKIHVVENPDESQENLEILNMSSEICTNGERGLQSVIPHPNFEQNRWLYAFYTKFRTGCLEDEVNGPWNVVARFTMDATTLQLNFEERTEIWRGA
jgi:hypothetical protein